MVELSRKIVSSLMVVLAFVGPVQAHAQDPALEQERLEAQRQAEEDKRDEQLTWFFLTLLGSGGPFLLSLWDKKTNAFNNARNPIAALDKKIESYKELPTLQRWVVPAMQSWEKMIETMPRPTKHFMKELADAWDPKDRGLRLSDWIKGPGRAFADLHGKAANPNWIFLTNLEAKREKLRKAANQISDFLYSKDPSQIRQMEHLERNSVFDTEAIQKTFATKEYPHNRFPIKGLSSRARTQLNCADHALKLLLKERTEKIAETGIDTSKSKFRQKAGYLLSWKHSKGFMMLGGTVAASAVGLGVQQLKSGTRLAEKKEAKERKDEAEKDLSSQLSNSKAREQLLPFYLAVRENLRKHEKEIVAGMRKKLSPDQQKKVDFDHLPWAQIDAADSLGKGLSFAFTTALANAAKTANINSVEQVMQTLFEAGRSNDPAIRSNYTLVLEELHRGLMDVMFEGKRFSTLPNRDLLMDGTYDKLRDEMLNVTKELKVEPPTPDVVAPFPGKPEEKPVASPDRPGISTGTSSIPVKAGDPAQGKIGAAIKDLKTPEERKISGPDKSSNALNVPLARLNP